MQIKLNKLVCIGFVLFLFLISAGICAADLVITPIEPKTISENERLTFNVTARDTANINATIRVEALNLPAGATFRPSTQNPNRYAFDWTPRNDSLGTRHVTFRATISGTNDSVSIIVPINVIGVDKTNLVQAIAAANGKIASVVPGNEINQYPQSAIDAFRAAISTAQGVADNTRATQTGVNNARSALATAEAAFDAARITSIDKSTLTTAIAEANAKASTATPGTGIGQYSQASIDTFRAAIAAAQTVANNGNATNAEVGQAVTSLRTAAATFDAARQAAPSSVTNLRETATGQSWIRWAWTNPNDADFNNVMVYLDGVLVTSTSSRNTSAYNATGLLEGSVHTIGIQTVDTAGNINPSIVTDQATTMTIDRAPPARVTGIKESNVGASWIHWTWTNPADPDFSEARIYIDGKLVTSTPNNDYNATGLSNGVEHTISIETVDTSGNINTEQVSDSATTLKLPVISNLEGKDIRTSSITLEWDASEDTATVHISQNGVLLANVTDSTYTHRDLTSSTTYNYTLVPYNQNGLHGEAVSISLTTSAASSGGGGGGGSSRKSSGGSSSTGSSSSGGGGGGGAGSVEDFVNVAAKDVDNEYLRMNQNVTYEFSREGNPIQEVSFYSLKNSGEITSTIEVLNNRSKLVSTNPEGLIYKHINIWVGKAGFATSENIRDARVEFIVNNSWIEEMEISAGDIKLQRYNGTAWEVLPTTLENNNTSYSIFEAQTPGFSPFAITAGKMLASANDGDMNLSNVEDIELEGTKAEKSRIWTYIMAFLLIGIIAVGYEYLKRQKN